MLSPIFENFESHTLTVLKKDSGEAWFLAKDFADPMGVGADAVRHRVADLDESDKDVISIHTPGGPQRMTFVSESGALQGTSVLVYLHEPTLASVNRTGWSARTAVLSEAQMGLFGGEA